MNDEDSCASLHMTKGSADIAYTKGPPVSVARTSSCMHTSLVGCISDTEDGHDFVADASRTALELRCILESMELSMVILGLSWQNAVYVQLFLSDMVRMIVFMNIRDYNNSCAIGSLNYSIFEAST